MRGRPVFPTGEFVAEMVSGEAYRVRVIAADVMRWEQVNQAAFTAASMSEFPLSRFAWIVWAALKRDRQIDIRVDEFMAQLAQLEQVPDADETADVPEDDVVLPDPTGADTTA